MSQKYEIECKKSFIIYCRKNCRKTLNERKQAEETNDILVRKFKLSDWQVHMYYSRTHCRDFRQKIQASQKKINNVIFLSIFKCFFQVRRKLDL